MPSITIRIAAGYWIRSCFLTTFLGVYVVASILLTAAACSECPADFIAPSFGNQLDWCANIYNEKNARWKILSIK